MSKKIRRVTNLRIYITYYLIFLLGAITFIVGLYTYDKGLAINETGGEGQGLITAGIISIVLGIVFVILSFIYSRIGSRVIGTNCPYCYGTGYVDAGKGETARQEVCPVCEGTGKMYDKATKIMMEQKQKLEAEKKEKKIEQEG
ncbi:MAG: hypothetical protein ACXABK_02825 [Candidatus Heimdallarchaeaceae archaeon]|jgi:hypothetical protein